MQETKACLANIFKMIGDKASTERGLVELWHFQRDHPETDINPHLARTSDQFRHYIQRGLSKVDRRLGVNAGMLQHGSRTDLMPHTLWHSFPLNDILLAVRAFTFIFVKHHPHIAFPCF